MSDFGGWNLVSIIDHDKARSDIITLRNNSIFTPFLSFVFDSLTDRGKLSKSPNKFLPDISFLLPKIIFPLLSTIKMG
ncbi:hypothetical protein B2J68_04235 [Vibrio cholerae]|nr:hypothetical protein B2J68_04235 [Vibrio cholerae]